MQLVYLTNGQACYLKEKIGEKYIVNKVFEHEQFYGDYSEMVEFIDENDIVVDVIFKAPPIPKFSHEITELIKKKDELQNDVRLLMSEKSKLSNEVAKLNTTKITNNKFILNKTELMNANRLALFAKDNIMPKVFDSKDKRFAGLKVSMETTICSNEERYWGYKLYFNEDYSSGDFLCPKYGILINPTENEIEETIKKRLLEFKFDDYKIARIDDKYLNSSQIEVKNAYLANERLKEKEKLDNQLVEIQEKLKKFDNVSSAV
jgi:hypothetical protein